MKMRAEVSAEIGCAASDFTTRFVRSHSQVREERLSLGSVDTRGLKAPLVVLIATR
jgi:hypothetical protein